MQFVLHLIRCLGRWITDSKVTDSRAQLTVGSSARVTLNPESDTFLDVKAVKHIMDPSRLSIIETEY